MAEQYLRKIRLQLFGGGESIDVSGLKLRFEVRQAEISTPKNMQVRIYNLAPDTQNQIEKQYTRAVLEAGYEGSFGTIFDGQIVYFRKGRENQTDTFLDVFANVGGAAYENAAMNAPIAAGTDARAKIDACLTAMAQFGVTAGYIEGLSTQKEERAVVLTGMVRDVLYKVCADSQVSWNVDDGGKLNIVPLDGYRADSEAVVLNSRTGLIGRVEQTLAGIHALALLNPNFRVGGLLEIDNASVNQSDQVGGAPLSGQYQPFDRNFAPGSLQYFASTAADGVYRIVYVTHRGDTRGNDWYSDVICIARDDAVPQALTQRGLA